MPLVEQELSTLPENLSSPLGFSGVVRVTRSLVLYVYFVDCYFSLFFWPLSCLFYFYSMYRFWLLLGIFKLFFHIHILSMKKSIYLWSSTSLVKPQTKDYIILVFTASLVDTRQKGVREKTFGQRYQVNMSKCGEISTHGSLSYHYKMSTKGVGLAQSGHEQHHRRINM